MRIQQQRGFTLLEIVILVLIVGVLVAAVLKGQEMITSAKVKRVARQLDEIRAAYFGFEDRYRALPGDYAQADVHLYCGGACLKGNGDSRIREIETPLAGSEVREDILVWTHLSSAGFLKGDYRMLAGSTISDQRNTPHNPYIIGNDILVCANYTDGVQIYNISNPSAVYRTGYFDTDTLINYPNYSQAYHGCWGAYTDLPSGLLLAADMQNGLFVLDISSAVTSGPEMTTPAVDVIAYPNPFNADFFVNMNTTKAQEVKWNVYDATGRVVLSATESVPAGPVILEIPAAELARGIYSVVIEGEEMTSTVKLVKE